MSYLDNKFFILPLTYYYSKYGEVILDISNIIDYDNTEMVNVLDNIYNKNICIINDYKHSNRNLCLVNTNNYSKNYAIGKDYYIIFYKLEDIMDLLYIYLGKHINFNVVENITLNPTSNIISISLYDYNKYIIEDYYNIKNIIITFVYKNIKVYIEFDIIYTNNTIYLIPNLNNYLNYDEKINDYIPCKFDEFINKGDINYE